MSYLYNCHTQLVRIPTRESVVAKLDAKVIHCTWSVYHVIIRLPLPSNTSSQCPLTKALPVIETSDFWELPPSDDDVETSSLSTREVLEEFAEFW